MEQQQQQPSLMQRVEPPLAGFTASARGKVALKVAQMDAGERQAFLDMTDGLLLDTLQELVRQQEGQAAVAAAGDTYVPQAWKQYIEKMDKWSEDMVHSSVLCRPWGPDLPPVEAAKKAA